VKANSSSGRSPVVATAVLGVAVGLTAGMFGIGGGALLVVGLVTLGWTQHGAHATSLAAIILTAAAAVVPFALAGEVALLAAAVLAPTAMLGAFLGAGLMKRIPERELRIAFGVFLILVALRMMVGVEATAGPSELQGAAYAWMALLGLATGVLSSIMGIGGGLLMVPALVLLFGFGQHAAEGTSLAVVIPTALVGAMRHSRSGYTAWRMGLMLGLAGIVGGVVGAQLALALEGLILQRLFAVFLILMSVRMLRKQKARGGDPPAAAAK
jgi:uncharacterized protein